MAQKDCLEFWRRNLESPDFDELLLYPSAIRQYESSVGCGETTDLLTVDDIPFLRLPITIHHITGLEVSVLIPRFGVGFRICKVLIND